MAVLLGGVGNLLLLGSGYRVLRWSKFQTAGRALSLLACLVMPLHLWSYRSNELITLDGHLWIPAVIISGICAATALVLGCCWQPQRRASALTYIASNRPA